MLLTLLPLLRHGCIDKGYATAIYGGEDGMTALLAKAAEAEKSATPVYIEAASTTKQRCADVQRIY